MKRILLLIKGLGRGGAEQLLASAAPYLDRERFEYEVAYLTPAKNALVAQLEGNGVPVRCLKNEQGSWALRFADVVRDGGFDLVHVHSPVAASAARVALPPEVPIVYTEHNLWGRYHPATYLANLVTYPRNTHVFAVSNHVRASIRYPAPLRFRRMPPVETLYHGIDHGVVRRGAVHDGVRAELGVPEGVPLIGTVANFKAHKGHTYLIEAAEIVRREMPEARFVLVGVGREEGQVRQLIRDRGLENTVVMAGFREDVPRVVAACEVFALASLQEGLSIALIEAMALGKPAVVTDVGGLPEVITHDQEGLLVPPRNPQRLGQAILNLLSDRRLWSRLSEGALARSKYFDIAKAVGRQEEIYEELLS